jgi:hypothetical protein
MADYTGVPPEELGGVFSTHKCPGPPVCISTDPHDSHLDYPLLCPGGTSARIDKDHSGEQVVLQHWDGSFCGHKAEDKPKGWHPTLQEGERLEDVPLSRWLGEALGHASVCWTERPSGVFDSTAAGSILDGLHKHVQSVIDGVIEGEREHSVQRATTRQLLNELRTRAEEWAQVCNSGSGWLADWVDDAYVTLEDSPMMDGRREP